MLVVFVVAVAYQTIIWLVIYSKRAICTHPRIATDAKVVNAASAILKKVSFPSRHGGDTNRTAETVGAC